jgi:hypothetical protein
MKTTTTIILFLITINLTLGQDKELNVPSIESFYSWTGQYKDLCNQIKISYLPTDTNNFWFRFEDHSQYTDIWTNDFKVFYGLITTSAFKINDKLQNTKDERLFLNQKIIDTAKAKQIYNLIISDSILSILSQKKNYISNSAKHEIYRYEGRSFYFEFSSKKTYTMKYYEEDGLPDTLTKDRIVINSLIKKLHTELILDKIYKDFFSTLPYGSYRGEGMFAILHTRKMDRYLRKHE